MPLEKRQGGADALTFPQPNEIAEAIRGIHSGSGMPDPSELEDGTALIAVNGEWKQQKGYGYGGKLEKAAVILGGDSYYGDNYYRVSDVPQMPDGFGVGSDITAWECWYDDPEVTAVTHQVTDISSTGVYAITFGDIGFPVIYIATEDNSIGTFPMYDESYQVYFLHKGVYFHNWVRGFAFGRNAAEKLISWDGYIGRDNPIQQNVSDTFTVKFKEVYEEKTDTVYYLADKDFKEILHASVNGRIVQGVTLGEVGNHTTHICNYVGDYQKFNLGTFQAFEALGSRLYIHKLEYSFDDDLTNKWNVNVQSCALQGSGPF